MTIITQKATVAQIPFGQNLTIEGLLLEDGSFAVAVPQIGVKLLNQDTQNYTAQSLKRLLAKDSKTHSIDFLNCKTEFNKNKTLAVSLLDFEKILRVLDKANYPAATELCDALVGLSLTQLFSDAFGIKFEKEDRQAYLKARAAGIVARKKETDAIKTYLATHEVSDNYRQWVYSNCSDKINLALFGKKAKKLKEERGCKDNDALRDSHGKEDLAMIERIEAHAARLILKGMEPQLATSDAIEFYCEL